MATTDPNPDVQAPIAGNGPGLLVVLSPMQQEQFERVLDNLSAAFPIEGLFIATPDEFAAQSYPTLKILATPPVNPSWTLTAADFANAHQLAQKHDARAILILGPEAGSLRPEALYALANSVLTTPTDLAVPCYELPAHAGLVNSAILYPLIRALFATQVRFPLAIDLGLSLRMAERLALAAQRFSAANQGDAILWPIEEASVAGFTVNEFDAGPRDLPHPTDPDINTILPLVTGSLFADIDAKAAYWQRPRRLPPARNPIAHTHSVDGTADIAPMIEAFRLAYSNLQEIWSLVLPPNSLLGLKRLSQVDAAAFRMPDSLWARIVFDFLIAYRIRTINRGHLLGALIPLYLAWAAGHINMTATGIDPERHIEAVAAAFEVDKPYMVARWRWPDRFNP
jgi:hypothetical protein